MHTSDFPVLRVLLVSLLFQGGFLMCVEPPFSDSLTFPWLWVALTPLSLPPGGLAVFARSVVSWRPLLAAWEVRVSNVLRFSQPFTAGPELPLFLLFCLNTQRPQGSSHDTPCCLDNPFPSCAPWSLPYGPC